MRHIKKILFAVLLMTTLMNTVVSAASMKSKLYASKSVIKENLYYIVPYNSPSKCLTINHRTNNITYNNKSVTTCIGNKSNHDANLWYITPSKNGTYRIINYFSGLTIGMKNNSTAENGVIRQNHDKGYNGQRWYLIDRGNFVIIQSAISKKTMSIKNNTIKNGQAVCIRTYKKLNTQRWKLIKYNANASEQATISAPKTTQSTTETSQILSAASSSKTKYKTSSKTGMNSTAYAVLNNIIGAVETGGQVYGVRNYGDYTAPYTNSSLEHTCTLGWGAFYGEEAQLLVKTIKARAPKTFANIDEEGIIAKKLNVNWVSTKWKPNAKEIILLKRLITTTTGKKIQDELFTALMKVYVSKCASLYTKNTYATMMYCEIAHLGGTKAANRIFDKCKNKFTLDSIEAALKTEYNTSNSVGSSKYWSRHMKCIEFIEKYA